MRQVRMATLKNITSNFRDKGDDIKRLITAFYVACNVFIYIWYLFPDEFYLMGYTKQIYSGILNPSFVTLTVGLLIIILQYVGVCYYLQRFYWVKIKSRVLYARNHYSASVLSRLQYLVLVDQMLLFIMYLTTGYGRAGGDEQLSNKLLTYYFSFLPPDYIFYVGYAITPARALASRINVLFFVFSSLARGWSGGPLIVLLFALIDAYRREKIRLQSVIRYFIILFFVAPVWMSFRAYLREKDAGDKWSFDRILDTIDDIILFTYNSFNDFTSAIIYNVINRFQQTDVAVFILEHREYINAQYEAGKFQSFMLEGWGGVIAKNLSSTPLPPQFMKFITVYLSSLNGYYLDANNAYSSNPTLFGWLLFSDELTAMIFIGYIFILMWFSSYLMCRLSTSDRANDMLWLMWFNILAAGWFGIFERFIQSQVMILLILWLIKRTSDASGVPNTTIK